MVVFSDSEQQKQYLYNQMRKYLLLRFQCDEWHIERLTWFVKILCYELRVSGASGRDKLIAVAKVWRGLAAAGGFMMPTYFLFAFLYVKIIRKIQTNFFLNKNILSNPDGVHFNGASLILLLSWGLIFDPPIRIF